MHVKGVLFDLSVDAQLKCEKWIRDDDNKSEESKMKWWVKRLIGRPKDVHISWPYPFAEGKLFVLTLQLVWRVTMSMLMGGMSLHFLTAL